ncbi:MAG: HemK/PrmC family methyltransferase, partial [Planctomycetota bacterium]
MSNDQPWTIGRLLTWTTDYLRERGAESPRLDAEVLLAHARRCQRIELYTAFEELADEELRTRFRALVRTRAGGQPVAYLVGSREFFSLSFEVSSEVLIPRPESEQLVVLGLDWLKQRQDRFSGTSPRPPSIADVGVGSGVLAVCLAKHFSAAQVVATDVSKPALEIARRNAERHDVAERIELRHGDLFDGLSPEVRFDLIVSNPP